ncbi:MAG: hypothetical protein WD490_08270 [Opitutales bacterium]
MLRSSLEAHGDTPPEADILLEDLGRYGPVINISELARRSGINKHTLATRLRRGLRFSEEQARKLRE